MIELAAWWSIPLLVVFAIQYGFGERYLINRQGKYRIGYFIVGSGLLLSIAYGVYVTQFVELMEALGVLHLIVISVLFHRFSGRYSKCMNQRRQTQIEARSEPRPSSNRDQRHLPF